MLTRARYRSRHRGRVADCREAIAMDPPASVTVNFEVLPPVERLISPITNSRREKIKGVRPVKVRSPLIASVTDLADGVVSARPPSAASGKRKAIMHFTNPITEPR